MRKEKEMLIKADSLPKTRLELRWREVDDPEWNMLCDYHLVLELDDLDIRGEVYDDDYNIIERETEKRVELGGTRTDRKRSPLDLERQSIETPFRDHSHITWDARRLKLPMFVVCDDWAMEIHDKHG